MLGAMRAKYGVTQWVVGALVALASVCCLATAIPNFLHFGARSKQSEAASTLREVLRTERAFLAKNGRWAESFEELSYEPLRGSRYRIALSREGEVLVPGHPDGGPHRIVAVDAAKLAPLEPDSAHPPAIPRSLWETLGVDEAGALTLVASGNVDADPTLDVWSISSGERVIDGVHVDAGAPYCHVDDTRR